MKTFTRILFITIFFSVNFVAFAQEEDDPFTVNYDTPLTIDLEADDEDDIIKPKKKKMK